MNRFKVSILAAARILILAFVLTAIGPKRVMAALGFTPVRDVDNPGRQPYAHQFILRNGEPQVAPIPPNKRLIVTSVSSIGRSTSLNIRLSTRNESGGDIAAFDVPYQPGGATAVGGLWATLAGPEIVWGESDRLLVTYFDATGTPVGVACWIYGYLVDVP